MVVNDPAVARELQILYHRYEAALVTNEVETLTEMFWNSPLTVRFGITENLHGHQEIATFRQSRPAKNLERTIRRIDILTFGKDYGQITVEFDRSVNERTVSGRQSQLWVRFAEGWRIVSAHVSLLP